MGKIAIVTGATRGIGRAIALKLASDGFDIWGVYKKSEQLAETLRKEIESIGRQCKMMRFDVSNFEEANSVIKPEIEKIDRNVDTLWALVNCAGITNDALLGWMKYEQWREVISINLDSVFIMTKLVMDSMIRQKGGRIVNITSVAGHTGNIGQTNYSASKAGIIAFTKSLAKELARMSITVNAVAAGFIETDMTSNLDIEAIKKTIPMRRFGKPEEVAGVVSFLCGSEASYITGAVIDVNGGIF